LVDPHAGDILGLEEDKWYTIPFVFTAAFTLAAGLFGIVFIVTK